MNETEIQRGLVSKLIASTVQSINSDKLLNVKKLIPDLSLLIPIFLNDLFINSDLKAWQSNFYLVLSLSAT
jgi:hypothetical protein